MNSFHDKTQINHLIIEDDLVIAEGLKENLMDLGYTKIQIVTNENEISNILKIFKPDLIISDIELGKNLPTGIDLIEKYKLHKKSIIIFLSSHDDSIYREQVIKLNAGYYLIKPVSVRQLDVAIDMAIRQAVKKEFKNSQQTSIYCPAFAGNTFVFVKTQTKFEKIFLKDICVIEAGGAYCKIETGYKPFTVPTNLGSFLDQIQPNPSIVRCHKSYAVNVDHIESFDQHSLYVAKGNGVVEIPLSISFRDEGHG